MRIPLWFLAGLALVALMAMFEAAPRLILLGVGGPRPGSFLDNGSLGAAELAGLLESRGATLAAGVAPPAGWRGPVVYLLSGPMRCGTGDAEELAHVIAGLAARGLHVGLVVAAGGNYTCGLLVAAALAGSAPVAVEQAPGLYLVLPGDGVRGSFVLLSPDRVNPPPGWRLAAEAVSASGDTVPAVLTARSHGVTLVFIPDWAVFTNALLRAEKEAGLDPGPGVASVFEEAAGGSLRGAVVIQPTVFLPRPRTPAGLVIHPGVALAKAAEDYARAEQRLYTRIIYNPFAVLVAAIVAAGAYYLASLGPADRGIRTTREKPAAPPEAGERRPTVEEALAALREAALVALGAEPASIAGDGEALRRLAEAAGVPERLARRALIAAQRGRPPRLGAGRVRDAALAMAEALAHWRRKTR